MNTDSPTFFNCNRCNFRKDESDFAKRMCMICVKLAEIRRYVSHSEGQNIGEDDE